MNQFSTSGRGGQSALRFARLRLEKRHNYVRKVAELATQVLFTDVAYRVLMTLSLSRSCLSSKIGQMLLV